MREMSNKEFADEFFRVIEEGQFSEAAMDFVDTLSHRVGKDPIRGDGLTENGNSFLRAFYKMYKGEPLTAREVAEADERENARGVGGVINNLVKKGYLDKTTKDGIRSYVYSLTEKGKEYCKKFTK